MRTYERYKDSGIEWIGEMPEHWEVKKMKYCVDLINGYSFKPEQYTTDGTPVVRIGDIDGNVDLENAKKVDSELLATLKDFIIKKGDILLALTGATIGKSALFNTEELAFLNQRVGILRTKTATNKQYIRYVIMSNIFREFVDLYCGGSAQENIGKAQLDNYFIQLPPFPEQTSIANYLDTKTTEIDQTIADKEALINLYEEEKKALINEAVTKGLNPTIKLKPSGIDWLGDIPEHWEVKKLKYLGIIKYGLGQPPKEKEEGLPLIRATNIERGIITENNLIFVDPDDIPYERDPVLKENDIIVVRSGAYTADSAIIPKKYEGAITGYDMVFRPNKVVPQFIAYCFLSNYVLNNQLVPLTIRAAQPHLNREELGDTMILFPPLQEQTAIVQYIETETANINEKITLAKQEIELLKEFRQALIFEAVTGKIKVYDTL